MDKYESISDDELLILLQAFQSLGKTISLNDFHIYQALKELKVRRESEKQFFAGN